LRLASFQSFSMSSIVDSRGDVPCASRPSHESEAPAESGVGSTQGLLRDFPLSETARCSRSRTIDRPISLAILCDPAFCVRRRAPPVLSFKFFENLFDVAPVEAPRSRRADEIGELPSEAGGRCGHHASRPLGFCFRSFLPALISSHLRRT